MANSDLKLEPHKVTNHHWWYEVNGGIEVYFYDGRGHDSSVLIPWKSVRNALARKDKPKDSP